ncbi:hypothetical protein M9Y10_012517 [Tritrichomonas musculus]|uniref:Uncharacterized protein n=1 Tax=Tritrichomonas musculus TaxID=1915356 RepID=A0ABR2IE07_9EUKA
MNRTNVNLTTCKSGNTGRDLLSALLINYDKNLLDVLLENNKLLKLEKLPVNSVSSKMVLDFGSYLIEHPKVTFVH